MSSRSFLASAFSDDLECLCVGESWLRLPIHHQGLWFSNASFVVEHRGWIICYPQPR